MNRYSIVCRLRWPAFLLLTGVLALLDQMNLISWGRAWPLYLILWGVLALAERAALASQPPAPGFMPSAGFGPGFPGGYPAGYPTQPGPFAGPAPSSNPVQPAPPYEPVSASIVPTASNLEIESTDAARQPRKSWEEEGR